MKGRGRRDGEEEAGRPTGGGRRRGSPGGSLRGRRRRVEDEVERMERERERAKTDRKDVGKVERGGKNRSCTVKENREYANGL